MSDSNSVSTLDEIRLTSGPEKLNTQLKRLISSNQKNAVNKLNDKNLSYASLFILKDTIDESNISSTLSNRNKINGLEKMRINTKGILTFSIKVLPVTNERYENAKTNN